MTQDTTTLMDAITRLTPTDRELVAASVGDWARHVDADAGDDPEARKAAYIALRRFVLGA